MQPAPINIAQDNQQFQKRFRLINFMWGVVSFVSITFSSYATFVNHPGYLSDWHAPVIILLAIFTLSLYCVGLYSRLVFNRSENWPPPFRRAIIFWGSIYLCITILSLIDNNFTYAYFITLGLCFALFAARRLVVMAGATFLSFCLLQGLFFPPFTQNTFATLIGIGISFLSMSLFALWMQHLISERFERNLLLDQLTRANTELQEAQHRLAETAAQEQELAVLRERTRLAREMHDTVGHALVLISIKLEAAQRLRERDPERCERELEATKEIARDTMNELRASIANLRSPALDHEPASRALSRYAQDMAQRAGIQLSCDVDADVDALPERVEETLWRVGQEALANIEKHARARHVQLSICRHDGSILMTISDDGVGLPAELIRQSENGKEICASPSGHFGLSGMIERVESIHGHISIRPGQERGMTIEVELPLVEAPLSNLQQPDPLRRL